MLKEYSTKDKISMAMLYVFSFSGGYLIGWAWEKLRQIGD